MVRATFDTRRPAPYKWRMTSRSPTSLENLLVASDQHLRELAWAEFLRDHSDLFLRVARWMGGDDDAVMDRYAFVLDALRGDDFQRLRVWVSDGRGEFAVWLVVVVRRLCLDQRRQRYGRQQGATASSNEQHAQRRQLVDLVGDELALAAVAGNDAESPEHLLRVAELRTALLHALDALPTSDRLLLRLRFEDELSVPTVARAIGVESPFPVYRRLENLLRVLRQALERVGVHDSSP